MVHASIEKRRKTREKEKKLYKENHMWIKNVMKKKDRFCTFTNDITFTVIKNGTVLYSVHMPSVNIIWSMYTLYTVQ